MTLVVAILAATAFAVFARPFSDYHYWWTWSRSAFAIGVMLYFALAGIGAGALGWGIGTVSGAAPTAWPLVDAALFGLVGALAIRAELGPAKSQRSRPGVPTSDQLAPAVTALNAGTIWTFDMVDRLVSRHIERWLRSLSDQELNQAGLEAASLVQHLDGVSDKAKETTLKILIPTMEALKAGGNDDDKLEPRIRLRGFTKTLFQQYRWPHP